MAWCGRCYASVTCDSHCDLNFAHCPKSTKDFAPTLLRWGIYDEYCSSTFHLFRLSLMSDPTYPLFPIVSGFGFVLVLIPLPWHLHAWNSGTCFFMLWAALACLNLFINSIVWAGNALNPAPWWCEICTPRLPFREMFF